MRQFGKSASFFVGTVLFFSASILVRLLPNLDIIIEGNALLPAAKHSQTKKKTIRVYVEGYTQVLARYEKQEVKKLPRP